MDGVSNPWQDCDACIICMEPVDNPFMWDVQPVMKRKNCDHVFHTHCLAAYEAVHAACPICGVETKESCYGCVLLCTIHRVLVPAKEIHQRRPDGRKWYHRCSVLNCQELAFRWCTGSCSRKQRLGISPYLSNEMNEDQYRSFKRHKRKFPEEHSQLEKSTVHEGTCKHCHQNVFYEWFREKKAILAAQKEDKPMKEILRKQSIQQCMFCRKPFFRVRLPPPSSSPPPPSSSLSVSSSPTSSQESAAVDTEASENTA